MGNIYSSKGQNGNIFHEKGISPTIVSGVTDNKKNGGVGSCNAPTVMASLGVKQPEIFIVVKENGNKVISGKTR